MFISFPHLHQVINRLLQQVFDELKTDFPELWQNAQQDQNSEKLLKLCEYYQRVSPSRAHITLAIGCLRLQREHPAASEAFGFLAQKFPFPLCQMLLIASHCICANWALAKQEISLYFSRYAPFPHPAFTEILTLFLHHNQTSSFCGLSLDGTLHYYTACPDVTLSACFSSHDEETSFILPAPATDHFCSAYKLPKNWQSFQKLSVTEHDNSKVFPAFDLRAFTQCRGFVEKTPTHITGWVYAPADPMYPIKVRALSQTHISPCQSLALPTHIPQLFDLEFMATGQVRHRFSVGLSKFSRLGNIFSVQTIYGHKLYGSPVLLTDTTELQEIYARHISSKFPALYKKNSLYSDKPCRSVALVIPVYSGLDATRICIERALRYKNAWTRIILVNDASPDPAICRLVKEYDARFSCITLLSLPENCGFPTAANTGLCERFEHEDVILLNSDTLVSKNWVERLQQAAYTAENIGTATPFSNNATIFSYPEKDGRTSVPSETLCDHLNDLAGEAWDGSTPDVPTAHGFCMYIKASCLKDTGLLRTDIFAQGYGEENDWSRRAAALGWRHVACPGVYVGHAESQSFTSVKTDLIARNLKLLNSIHPGYDALVKKWQDQDPLLPFRRALDLRRLAYDKPNVRSVLLVTHDRQGGLTRHVDRRGTFYLTHNIVPFQLKPIHSGSGKLLWQIAGFPENTYPNLIVPRNPHALKALLTSLNCTALEIHSYIGHTLDKVLQLRSLKLPYDIYIHDYSWYCPRITLTGEDGVYCGEPASKQCQTCLETCGSNTGETTSITRLRTGSQSLFHHARTVYAPSHDTANRIKRQLGVSAIYRPWETLIGTEWPHFPIPSGNSHRTIGILGAIGLEKGYTQLLALARLAAQLNAPIQFVLIGYSCNDRALLETGVVHITGRYKEHEIQDFVRQHTIDWFFMPSIWPETWSYVLTQIWRTEKPVIAYDIGAQAERIKQAKGSMVVPMHLPYPRLLSFLYNPMPA